MQSEKLSLSPPFTARANGNSDPWGLVLNFSHNVLVKLSHAVGAVKFGTYQLAVYLSRSARLNIVGEKER